MLMHIKESPYHYSIKNQYIYILPIPQYTLHMAEGSAEVHVPSNQVC